MNKTKTKIDKDIIKNLNSNVTTENQIQSDKTAELKKSPNKTKLLMKLPISKKLARIIIVSFIALFALVSILILQIKSVANEAKLTEAAARKVYDALKTQDLFLANQELQGLKTQVDRTSQKIDLFRWFGFIPFIGEYWKDADRIMNAAEAGVQATEIMVKTIEPYADVIGFSGQGSFMGGTAEDRIVKIVETLDKVTPELDSIAEKLKIVNQNISDIDPKRYPFYYQGKKIDQLILTGQEYAKDALFAVTTAKPAIQVLPQVLAVEGERKYMVLFQNDAELRATGGFMTAYGILRVEKGKIFQEKSEDIYTLDSKLNSQIPAPEMVRKYLPLVYRKYIRDVNISPDFKVSMDEFLKMYQSIPGEPKVDGIISVDTQVLSDIIEVLGPIEVPGYETYSVESDPRCDCPQVIYELELLADRPVATLKQGRKDILAPMLQAILTKAYGSPKQIWPKLFQVVTTNIGEKHVLFYLLNESEQQAAEQLNIAGRIREFDGDYLHINDINFAGAKSNMFINQEVEQTYEIGDDRKITKTVSVKYQNPFPASNCNLEAGQLCLNGTLRNVIRLYVPNGSKLIEAQGSEIQVETKEDLGKTVFEGFFTLQPNSQAKLVMKYELPFKLDKDLKLFIQKQPGTKKPLYRIITPDGEEEFDLLMDKEYLLAK
jgi:hypothetical protein